MWNVSCTLWQASLKIFLTLRALFGMHLHIYVDFCSDFGLAASPLLSSLPCLQHFFTLFSIGIFIIVIIVSIKATIRCSPPTWNLIGRLKATECNFNGKKCGFPSFSSIYTPSCCLYADIPAPSCKSRCLSINYRL